jgi:hypothetical protein
MPAQFDIDIQCGRDYTLALNYQTAAGNPIDLTGFEIILTIKKLITDTDAEAIFQLLAPSSDPSTLVFGNFYFQIPNSETAGFPAATAGVYGIDLVSPTAYEWELMQGAANFNQSVLQVIP